MDEHIINAVIDAGFTPYMRSRSDSWLYFTDGTRIGYLQWNRYDGLSLSTVQKPNTKTGTGFKIDLPHWNVKLDRETLEKALEFAPSWAASCDRSSVQKFRDMNEFLKWDRFNAGYTPVEKAEASRD